MQLLDKLKRLILHLQLQNNLKQLLFPMKTLLILLMHMIQMETDGIMFHTLLKTRYSKRSKISNNLIQNLLNTMKQLLIYLNYEKQHGDFPLESVETGKLRYNLVPGTVKSIPGR